MHITPIIDFKAHGIKTTTKKDKHLPQTRVAYKIIICTTTHVVNGDKKAHSITIFLNTKYERETMIRRHMYESSSNDTKTDPNEIGESTRRKRF